MSVWSGVVSRLAVWLRRSRPPADPRYPEWNSILGRDIGTWRQALAQARNGPKVLLASSAGGFTVGATLDSVLAVALTLRGANVAVLLCDGALPACMQAKIGKFRDAGEYARQGPARLCDSCRRHAVAMYKTLGIPVYPYSAFAEASEAGTNGADEGEVGEHARAGALRYYARGNLTGELHAESVLDRYRQAGRLTAAVCRGVVESFRPDVVCADHGIYVPQGIVAAATRAAGIRLVTWNPAYRKRTFIFSHHDTYHHTLMDEPAATWESLPWSPAMEKATTDYLRSRWTGERDWIWFHDSPITDVTAITRELKVDFSRPCIGLLTNVVWDAQLHYRANAFPDMTTWIFATIRHFALRPDMQLIIRVHPAEIRGTVPSRQRVTDEIAREFPVLPSNVHIIGPESRISTYPVMEQCNAVLIYGTKTGVELVSQGIPVIVAGEAWIRNKGLTMDAHSPEEYRALLDRLPLAARLDAATVARARKYAFHFFFRRMIPLEIMEPGPPAAPVRLSVRGCDKLRPGGCRGLDTICDGILRGAEFVYPAEAMPM